MHRLYRAAALAAMLIPGWLYADVQQTVVIVQAIKHAGGMAAGGEGASGQQQDSATEAGADQADAGDTTQLPGPTAGDGGETDTGAGGADSNSGASGSGSDPAGTGSGSGSGSATGSGSGSGSGTGTGTGSTGSGSAGTGGPIIQLPPPSTAAAVAAPYHPRIQTGANKCVLQRRDVAGCVLADAATVLDFARRQQASAGGNCCEAIRRAQARFSSSGCSAIRTRIVQTLGCSD